MISTELLSKVIGSPHKYKEINIYELAHKCKEWIYKNSHYSLIVNDNIVYLDAEDTLCNEGGFYYDANFIADSEPDAIFLACEWVMKQKELE